MKPREPRRKVLIGARMRLNGSFCDVRIRNVSSKGMLLEAAKAPGRGTYVELLKGRHVIVARVMWSSSDRFGVLAQDKIDIEAIISAPDQSGPRKVHPATQLPVERRSSSRRAADEIAQRAVRSRYVSAAVQFGCIICFGVSMSVAIFGVVEKALSAPMTTLEESFAKK